jgi:DNA-binding GntR family transcriptional regulator
MSVSLEQVPPLRRISLADAAYETLLEAILHGQLPPGEELSAVALAARFQISRTPVTEALQRLAHDGLIEQTTNHKPRVAQLSREDVIDIYDVRGHLEAAAVERAAKRVPEQVLVELRGQADALLRRRKDVDWAARAIQFDLQFHDVIAEHSGNRRLRDDVARYRRLVRCFCRLTGKQENLRQALDEHLQILEALEQRRGAAAAKAMQAHIQNRLQAVLAELYPAT